VLEPQNTHRLRNLRAAGRWSSVGPGGSFICDPSAWLEVDGRLSY
jgi:hypothetical protein